MIETGMIVAIQKENEKYYDMFKNRQRNVQEEQTQTFNQLMVIEKNGI